MTEGSGRIQEDGRRPWYQRNVVVIVSLLAVGPLALPVVWFNHRYSLKTKIVITLVVGVFSYFLGVATIASLKMINEMF